MAQEFPDDATSAAVIGCGPVGLMAILAAQAQGAQKVHICPLCVGLSPVCWSVSTCVPCMLVCLHICPLCVGLSPHLSPVCWSVSTAVPCVLVCLLCVSFLDVSYHACHACQVDCTNLLS